MHGAAFMRTCKMWTSARSRDVRRPRRPTPPQISSNVACNVSGSQSKILAIVAFTSFFCRCCFSFEPFRLIYRRVMSFCFFCRAIDDDSSASQCPSVCDRNNAGNASVVADNEDNYRTPSEYYSPLQLRWFFRASENRSRSTLR